MSSHTFSIENNTNPSTGKPFGQKYAGVFAIRRPSLLDKKNIALRDAAAMSTAGEVNLDLVSNGTRLITYIFSFVESVNEQPLPEWFNMATMFDDEDEDAVLEVWKEVGKFLDTFRPKADGNDSKQGSEQPSLLVQA